MLIIQERVEGDTNIELDTVLNGIVVGSVTIFPCAKLHVNGMITGNLFLQSDSAVTLNGVVNGDVVNSGGVLAILGIVNGKVERKGGRTDIDKGAIVIRGVE